ncbi:MAG: ribosome small subunit-dependent GTPase A [Duodenibacillus sp.]|nr:ribosome small subunit-dependent GTPase A [Duodenibacillus sp.]
MAKPARAKAKKAASAAAAEPTLSARVTRTHGRHHFVTDDEGRTFEAHRRGKKADVVVGDLVHCTEPQGNVVAIESIEPRRNLLYRSDEWRIKELAANLDLVAVVFAPRPAFNPWFVWKAVVAARTEGIALLLIRNKTDLLEDRDKMQDFCRLMHEECGEDIVEVSATTEINAAVETISGYFAGKTVLLVGQSGMGKSTILNALCPEAAARTQEYSQALNLGKQTTTTTTLYSVVLDGLESAIIDSPGFQEFGLAHVDAPELIAAMPDLARRVSGCRFYNCTHTNEPGCSVRAALEEGQISKERYAFYCALMQEIKNRRP